MTDQTASPRPSIALRIGRWDRQPTQRCGHVRAAWAHYFRRDADLTASLTGLPGARFSATGAEADRNSALVSAGIMAKLSERVSLGLDLDGELSANGTRTGGSARIRVNFRRQRRRILTRRRCTTGTVATCSQQNHRGAR